MENPKERVLHFASQVDQGSVNSLVKNIIEINDHDKRLKKEYKINGLVYEPKPIKIYIDSYGGSVYQCLGLLSIMNNSKTPIHTICTGVAMSAGFMILIHGHKRYAHEYSTMMYHQLSSLASGTMKELEESISQKKRLQKLLEDLVVNKTDIPKEKIEKIYHKKKDWYINSKEALKLKVIDKII